MSLHLYTYFTSSAKAKYLMETARFHNIEVKNLALSDVWQGFHQKMIRMLEVSNTLPDDDIICFVDSYDLLVNTDSETLINTFKSFNRDLVFGAEINLHPGSLKDYSYPESSTQFRYLNSGFYIGYVKAIRKMFSSKVLEGDDQEYMNRYFLENINESIKLDTEAKLVLNMYRVPWDKLIFSSGKVIYPDLNTVPCFIHFNGMSYLDINKDCIRNGNNISFNYYAVHDTTFSAVLGSKMLTKSCDVVCKLTGRGTSY
jgi:hypothetical protein